MIAFRLGFLSLSLTIASAPACAAQTQRPVPPNLADSSVARIMAEAQHGLPTTPIIQVLRQQKGPQPQAKRDALGDALVARAIQSPGGGSALVAIASAGFATAGRAHGTPEPRALEWLIRVHRESRDPNTRREALVQITAQVNPERAAGYLRQVVTSKEAGESAGDAMQHLIRLALSPALVPSEEERARLLTDLRELWDRGLVSDKLALVFLRELAADRRWPHTR